MVPVTSQDYEVGMAFHDRVMVEYLIFDSLLANSIDSSSFGLHGQRSLLFLLSDLLFSCTDPKAWPNLQV